MSVNKQTTESIFTSRLDIQKLRLKVKMNSITFITTVINTLPPWAQIIKNHWYTLRGNFKLKDIFQESGTPTEHWPNNFTEIIGSTNIQNNKVIHMKPTIKSSKFYQPCNIRNNLCCAHLKSIYSFTSFTTKKIFKIYHKLSSWSKNINY